MIHEFIMEEHPRTQSKRARRVFNPIFKKQIVTELQNKTLDYKSIKSKYSINRVLVDRWKKEFLSTHSIDNTLEQKIDSLLKTLVVQKLESILAKAS